jgi:hypothetical protein
LIGWLVSDELGGQLGNEWCSGWVSEGETQLWWWWWWWYYASRYTKTTKTTKTTKIMNRKCAPTHLTRMLTPILGFLSTKIRDSLVRTEDLHNTPHHNTTHHNI